MSEQSVNLHISSSEDTKENKTFRCQNIEESYITQDNPDEYNLNIVNELQKKLEYALNSIKKLTQKLLTLENNNTKLHNSNTELIKKMETLKISNKELAQKVETIETINACLKASNEELIQKVETVENTNTNLKSSNEELIQKVKTIETNNTDLKTSNKKLTKQVEIIETSNTEMKKKLERMENDNNEIKRKITELEVLIVRNNINIDLLANRDSLKSLLLILSINLGYSTNNDIIKDSKILKYKEKFSNLVFNVLSKLSSNLQTPFSRAGITPILSDIDTYKKYIIFVECIDFIVLSIDNIVHPPNDQTDEDVFSKLVGKRNIATLDEGLIHFFKNPKSIKELIEITKKEKNEINQVNIENYDSAKNNAYLVNKSFYNELKGNNYKKGFYIQYLFDPGKDNFSQVKMNLDYENFKSQMNKIISKYNEKKLIYGYDAEFLIANLKWFS